MKIVFAGAHSHHQRPLYACQIKAQLVSYAYPERIQPVIDLWAGRGMPERKRIIVNAKKRNYKRGKRK